MFEVFISYAREDLHRAMPLVQALTARGWSVWWDHTILPGQTWDSVIGKALEEARCIVVLWSRNSVASDWVMTEAEEGRERHILVPVLLEDVRVPRQFRRIQAAPLVDWAGESGPGFEMLCRGISVFVAPQGAGIDRPTGEGREPGWGHRQDCDARARADDFRGGRRRTAFRVDR